MIDPDVTAAAHGDAEAFARLVDVHRAAICAIAFALTSDRGASEDAAQEAFVAAWRALPELRDPRRFRSWLHQIVRNQARMHNRSPGVRRRLDDDGPIERQVAADPSAEHALEEEQDADAVRRALHGLDPAHREVLVLYYREDQPVAELARALELTEPTARKRLERARAALRVELDLVAPYLRDTRPRAAFTAAILAAIASWPRQASAATGSTAAAWSRAGWMGTMAGGVLGALVVVAVPLLAAPDRAPEGPRPGVEVATSPAPADPGAARLAPTPVREPQRPRSLTPPTAGEPLSDPDVALSPPARPTLAPDAAAPSRAAIPAPTTPPPAPLGRPTDIDARISFKSGSSQLDAQVQGQLLLDDSLTHVVAATGLTIILEQVAPGDRRVEIRGDGRGPVALRMWRNHGALPFDEEGRLWLAAALQTMVAQSDALAGQQIAGRPTARVLDALPAIRSRSARLAMISALASSRSLDPADQARALTLAAEAIPGDDLRAIELLELLSTRLPDDPAVLDGWTLALGAVRGSAARLSILSEVARSRPSPALVAATMRSIRARSSAAELRAVLAELDPLARTPEIADAWRDAALAIRSDTQRRWAVDALVDAGPLDAHAAHRALEVIASIRSSVERRGALDRIGPALPSDPAVTARYQALRDR